jgi:hypothetical protein
MDRIKSAVIITLDFFKIIDGFEEEAETNQPGGEEDNCQHIVGDFALKRQIGCRIIRAAPAAGYARTPPPATLSK